MTESSWQQQTKKTFLFIGLTAKHFVTPCRNKKLPYPEKRNSKLHVIIGMITFRHLLENIKANNAVIRTLLKRITIFFVLLSSSSHSRQPKIYYTRSQKRNIYNFERSYMENTFHTSTLTVCDFHSIPLFCVA